MIDVPMIHLHLANASVVQGAQIPVEIVSDVGKAYAQVQLEIFDAGVRNPTSKLGFGAPSVHPGPHRLAVSINTVHLPFGLYEIGLVRLHGALNPASPPQIDFVPGRDFGRQVFEVTPAGQVVRSQAELLEHIMIQESELENQFLAPVDVRAKKDLPAEEYCVFVFIESLLVGTRIRFDRFEILPTGGGLDGQDSLHFVNEFLRTRTAIPIQFQYEDALRTQTRQSHPVCVAHFPLIVASNPEEAKKYCLERTDTLLLAMSLSRDAGGTTFDTVVFNRKTNEAFRYTVTRSYVGNLLTGQLAGENPESIEAYLSGLANSPFLQFLAGLYKEARRESSIDFQYVRFWQILEILAESRNYDPKAPLVDYSGDVIMDGEKPRLTKSGASIVFNLLRESGIGNTESSWKFANTWFAFRTAAAHHGSISRFAELDREDVRTWGRIGFEEIQREAHDKYLWNLKEDTKLLLMRELVSAKVGQQ
ncbi:MAG: hypothetical protein IPM03_08525 [Sulfuritalea sp.]|nr:hypothetical protein [Sulfuritalea sp.]